MASISSSSQRVNLQPIYTAAPNEVYRLLKSSAGGLSNQEAADRLRQYGRNVISEIKGTPLILKFLLNFTHLMALLLWVGGVIALVAQLPQLAVAIWLVNVINGLFSFWQEFRAEQAAQALQKLLPLQARVIRDQQEQRVSAELLAPGDVLFLEEGDRISADCRLVDASELCVDQATLTGEALSVTKRSEALLAENRPVVEISNLVFAGTNVVSGTGRAIVYATGMDTEFGKIARLTQMMGEAPSPLQRELETVTRIITLIAVGVGVLFLILAVLLAHMELAKGFIFALGMIVAFVPEGLLPTVTLALAMGVQRMAKRSALIKKLSSVETLGCTTVICTDKTGTLTQNAMFVSDIWVDGQTLKVSGSGYAPEGSIGDEEQKQDSVLWADLQQMLLASALCNNARLLPPKDEHSQWTTLGDPTEAALRVAAPKGGINLERAAQEYVRVRELPFDSHRKCMSTLHRPDHQEASGLIAFVKGAPNEILQRSTRIRIQGCDQPLTETLLSQINAVNDQYANNGLRVLAVAMRCLPALDGRVTASAYTVDVVEHDLTFLGLMAMMDLPRPEVAAAVAKCHSAGIRVIMITGDYGLTAESVARRIGIVRGEHPRIVTGHELETMTANDLKLALENEVIFARAAPEQKLQIVNALQELGNVVAVTGDGVNDAPALKKADIGVAMGITGTDVAKEAADVILTDDNFASIVNAVEEGRAVYANIKKFTTYIFTSNTPEAVPFILFAFSAGRIPLALNVMHILAIDLGTDLVPALGLGAEPPEPGMMEVPPRRLKDHLITKEMLLRAYLWLGLLQSLAVMAAFYFMYWMSGYAGQLIDLPAEGQLYASATAMALSAVVTTQIGNVFTQRTERISLFRLNLFGNRLILIGVVTELLLVVAIVYLPFMQTLIGTNGFPPSYWLFLFAWTPTLIIMDEIRKVLVRRRARLGR